jgi:ABC-type multidrug transport system ATPase subunit
LRDVSFELPTGYVMGLIGANGAGKTTTIRCLLGMRGFETGEIELLGEFELDLRAKVKDLSRGMAMKLMITLALSHHARLLVFDEPTSGLDPASRAQVYETIDRLRADGATVLISTHALAEIEDRVDRAAIMHKGRLLAAGTLGELRQGVRADLRIRLQVVPCSTRQVLTALPAAARCIESTDRTLVLQVPPAAKMEALRAIAACGERILDFEVHAPGLQELYAQLVSASGEES